MKYETIEIQKENFVATVFLNRPEVHNAMNEKLMKELTECFKNFYLDNSVRTIILTGRGKSFCAGADLNWMKSMAKYNIKENIKDSRLLSNLFSEVKLGIIPSVISTYIVRRIGLANMRRLFLTGERFESHYAKSIGLIDFVVPEDELDEILKMYIELLRSSGPNAIKEIKNLVNACENMDRKNYIEHTIEKIAELRVSKEGQEGINAFLEKRKSKWSG